MIGVEAAVTQSFRKFVVSILNKYRNLVTTDVGSPVAVRHYLKTLCWVLERFCNSFHCWRVREDIRLALETRATCRHTSHFDTSSFIFYALELIQSGESGFIDLIHLSRSLVCDQRWNQLNLNHVGVLVGIVGRVLGFVAKHIKFSDCSGGADKGG